MKKLLPLALALCCLSGCYKSTFVYNSAGGSQVLEETRSHKLFGLMARVAAKRGTKLHEVTDADIRDEGVRYRTLTNIAIGGAAVCAGLGVYLLVSGDSNTTGSARLSLRARGDRVTASWTF